MSDGAGLALSAYAAVARAVDRADEEDLREAGEAFRGQPQELLGLLRYLHLYFGFPRVVRGLGVLLDEGLLPEADKERTPAVARAEASAADDGGAARARGEERFRHLYGEDAEPVLARLTALDPRFRDWILGHAYGSTGDGHELPLALAERLAVLALAATGCWAQCRSHLRGALRHGVTADQLRGDLTAADWLDAEQRAGLRTLLEAEAGPARQA